MKVAARRKPMGVEAVREAVREAVEATTLRRVAGELGVSAPGLALFLDGAVPRESTLDRYRAWYFGRSQARPGASAAVALLALDVVAQSVPARDRPRARRRIVEMLVGINAKQRVEVPDWLRRAAAAADPPVPLPPSEPPG